MYAPQPFNAYQWYPRFQGAVMLPPGGGGLVPAPAPLGPPPRAPYPRQPVPGTPPMPPQQGLPANPGPFPPGGYPMQPVNPYPMQPVTPFGYPGYPAYPGSPIDCYGQPVGGFGCGPMAIPGPEMAMAYQQAQALACAADQEAVRRGQRAAALSELSQIPLSVETAENVTLNPNEVFTFEASPDVATCLLRFEVPRWCSSFFSIRSMRAARKELLTNGAAVPCDSFAPDAKQTPRLDLPRLWPGTKMYLTVKNNDAAPHAFNANWWGIPLDEAQGCL